MRYKSAAFYFDSTKGLSPEIISSLDEWLNTWLSNGYIVDEMSEINKNGTTTGYLHVFKIGE